MLGANSVAGVVYAKGDAVEKFKNQAIRMTGCSFDGSNGSDTGIEAGATLYTDQPTGSFRPNARGSTIQPIASIPPNFGFIEASDPSLREIQVVRTCSLPHPATVGLAC